MSFEDVSSVEAFLGGGSRSRTESADHISFVMGKGVAVFIVFARKPLLVEDAGRDWAFLRPFGLVSKQMCLEIFEGSSAVRVWATSPLSTFLIEAEGSWALHGIARMAGSDRISVRLPTRWVGLERVSVKVGRTMKSCRAGTVRFMARCL